MWGRSLVKKTTKTKQAWFSCPSGFLDTVNPSKERHTHKLFKGAFEMQTSSYEREKKKISEFPGVGEFTSLEAELRKLEVALTLRICGKHSACCCRSSN